MTARVLDSKAGEKEQNQGGTGGRGRGRDGVLKTRRFNLLQKNNIRETTQTRLPEPSQMAALRRSAFKPKRKFNVEKIISFFH